MRQTTSKWILRRALSFALSLLLVTLALAQTPNAPPPGARGVIRLRVRVGDGEGTRAKGLARKRFYLIKGSLDENKSLFQSIDQRPMASRDCYYRGIGASEALIHWLREGDCESVYCREVEQNDLEGAGAVPEFQQAVAAGEKQFGGRELARKWLAAYLSDNIKSGFYKRQQQGLQMLLKQAEENSKAQVLSVMTDQNGTAYFTDVEPGTYVITNMLPTELGSVSEMWQCPVKVAVSDLTTATREKPFLIANPGNKDPRDKNIRCVSVEKALPVCPALTR
jgi:hypothetical protein